jgi:integrase
VRSFRRICDHNHLRRIKVHHLRHTTATLLKNLGVPARDAQLILGHSRLAVTLEIYSDEDR